MLANENQAPTYSQLIVITSVWLSAICQLVINYIVAIVNAGVEYSSTKLHPRKLRGHHATP